MIKGVIFDLDGVIVTTDNLHYLAWKAIADKEKIEFNKEINNRLRGVSRMASLDIILEKAKKEYTQEEKNALAEAKNNIYVESLKKLSKKDLLLGVEETLNVLKEKGIKLAIGSSSKNTNRILEQLEIKEMFDVIVDGNMISHSKPDPEVFVKAKDLLGLDNEEVLVVEDAEAGIDAANSGNMKSCGINGADKYDKATYKLNNIKDILDIVESSSNSHGGHIEIKHVKKIYPNGFEAVHDFNLEIGENEFVVFVGPSGCGKSTMLRMVAGLEEISDGELIIDGEVLNDTDPKDRNIAMVFQNYALYPHLTVRKNIAFPLSNKRIPFKKFFSLKYRKERRAEIKRQVEEAAEIIGLSDRLDSYPRNLSGGQRQRVALGRAIVRKPKVFLLDEPLSNLDAKMRGQMRSEITNLQKKLQTTFIYVTHDQVEAMTMGSKIVVMKDGYIQQVSSPDELFLHPVNKFVAGFIGTPPMNFINAKLDDKKNVLFGNIVYKTSKEFKNKVSDEYMNNEVYLGIRPKAIFLKNDYGYVEQKIKAKVTLCEHLGEDCLIYCDIQDSEEKLIISTSLKNKANENDVISICLDEPSIYLFDKESEKAIF